MFLRINFLIFVIFGVVKINCGENIKIASEISIPNDQWFEDKLRMVKDFLENSVIIGLQYGNYSFADENIWILGEDPSNIKWIVHILYYTNASNFGMLLDYATESSLPKTSSQILYQLFQEIKFEKHPDPIKFCEIYKTLDEIVKNLWSLDTDYVEHVKTLSTNLRSETTNYTASLLKSALDKNIYESIHEIADRVYETEESIFDDTICVLISDLYNQMQFGKLLQDLWTHKLIGQKAAVLICAFETLYLNMDKDLEGVMTIAFYFYKIKLLPDYSNLIKYKKNEIESNIKKLPISVQNLYFKNFICIRNVKSHTWFASELVYNGFLHSVYLPVGGYVEQEARKWYVEHLNVSDIKFRSKKYDKEYLYAGDTKRGILKPERLVFTKSPGDNSTKNIEKGFTWQVSLHKNGNDYEIRITSKDYGEILCWSAESPFYYRKTVYEYAVTKDVDGEEIECHWTVDTCH